MDVNTILTYLDDESTYQSNWLSGIIHTGFSINAPQYLSFAMKDFQSEEFHGGINAIRNLRSALCSQIDSLLVLLGYGAGHQIYSLEFPDKKKLLKMYGIEVPEKLNAVNQSRNDVDHRYSNYNKEMFQTQWEGVSLFVEQTRFFAKQFPCVVEYSNHIKQEEYGFYQPFFLCESGRTADLYK